MILVVDDDWRYRDALVDNLRMELQGKNVLGVAELSHAVILLDDGMVDVLIVDICLQSHGGQQDGHQLAAMALDYNVPTIMISGHEGELAKARETHEAIGYVLKEATPQSLTAILTYVRVALTHHPVQP